MPATLIGLVLLVAILFWLIAPRRRPPAAPEDDLDTPVDEEALAEAERALREDARPRERADGFEDEEDDWGPGTA